MDDLRVNTRYDTEIERLWKEHKWGAYRIWLALNKDGKQRISVATIHRRLMKLRK
jgi:hypothetical protein